MIISPRLSAIFILLDFSAIGCKIDVGTAHQQGDRISGKEQLDVGTAHQQGDRISVDLDKNLLFSPG